jgi:hypothetical protein
MRWLLGTLAAGWYFSNVSNYVPYVSPPYGNYYTTLTVEEYTEFGYVIRDWISFDGTRLLGNPSGPKQGLSLYGKLKYQISKKGARLRIQNIYNGDLSGVSGSLRVELWATDTYYSGGDLSGYVVASKDLDPLNAGYGYVKFDTTVPYNLPPPGYYFMVMALEEYTASGWVIRDYVTFPKLKRFR